MHFSNDEVDSRLRSTGRCWTTFYSHLAGRDPDLALVTQDDTCKDLPTKGMAREKETCAVSPNSQM
jgi:hypothetical protein